MPRATEWRRYLLFNDWPRADRTAWETAVADGDVLEGRGPAAHWAPATMVTNRRHYGRWLGFLCHLGLLTGNCAPNARVTRESVRAFVEHLQSEVAPRTVVCTLVGLKVTMKAMYPRESWRWLADLCNALNRMSEPRKDKRARMRPAEEIYSTAIAELDRVRTTPLSRRIERVAFRDSLMLALMVARPLRLKNFIRIKLGEHLAHERTGWDLRIPGAQVKNGQPLDFTFPDALVPYLEIYLDRVRPSFLPKPQSSALWLGYRGAPLTAHGAYYRFIFITKRLLNVAINPHLLRDCAATSLANQSPAAALAAGALLGHRNSSTTERYYIHANRLQASRALNSVLSSLRETHDDYGGRLVPRLGGGRRSS